MAALELEVEEKLKEKVLQDLETERQTLENAKNQFQQEVRIFKLEYDSELAKNGPYNIG